MSPPHKKTCLLRNRDGTPRSLRDLWKGRDLTTFDAAFSGPACDLLLLFVDGPEKQAAEYVATQSDITAIQATDGSTFALLQYANSSGHVAVVRVKSTSGLATAIALPPAAGSETERLA